MIIMRRQDESLSGIFAVTVQISTASTQLTAYKKQAEPEGCKRAQQGEYCCQDHCILTMHHNAQTKLNAYKRKAVEIGDVEGEFDDEEQTDAGIFQSISLDIEAALGTTNLL